MKYAAQHFGRAFALSIIVYAVTAFMTGELLFFEKMRPGEIAIWILLFYIACDVSRIENRRD